MGILTSQCEAPPAHRVARGTVKRCRIQQLRCRDAYVLVSRLIGGIEHSAIRCLTKRFLCSRHWCMGSVTSAVAACGQPCLLRGNAHAVAVSREPEDEVGKSCYGGEAGISLHVSLHLEGTVMRQSHLPTTAVRLLVICG